MLTDVLQSLPEAQLGPLGKGLQDMLLHRRTGLPCLLDQIGSGGDQIGIFLDHQAGRATAFLYQAVQLVKGRHRSLQAGLGAPDMLAGGHALKQLQHRCQGIFGIDLQIGKGFRIPGAEDRKLLLQLGNPLGQLFAGSTGYIHVDLQDLKCFHAHSFPAAFPVAAFVTVLQGSGWGAWQYDHGYPGNRSAPRVLISSPGAAYPGWRPP